MSDPAHGSSDAPVGLLALQGDFALHRDLLAGMGVSTRLVRRASELAECRALVLPGGETTTLHRLLRSSGLLPELVEFAANRPVLGTCAGAILMARHISDAGGVEPLGLIDITIQRNAYGRQVDSFEAELGLVQAPVAGGAAAGADPAGPNAVEGSATAPGAPRGVFIRAPRILALGAGVQVLAVYQQSPVAVCGGLHMALTFHPEVGDDPRWHRAWLARATIR